MNKPAMKSHCGLQPMQRAIHSREEGLDGVIQRHLLFNFHPLSEGDSK
jgi:hypothetical protein